MILIPPNVVATVKPRANIILDKNNLYCNKMARFWSKFELKLHNFGENKGNVTEI